MGNWLEILANKRKEGKKILSLSMHFAKPKKNDDDYEAIAGDSLWSGNEDMMICFAVLIFFPICFFFFLIKGLYN